MKKILNNKLIYIGSIALVASTPLISTSCNIRYGRTQKDAHLSKEVFESNDFKKIEHIIQNKFHDKLIAQLYTQYYNDNIIKPKSSWYFSKVASAKTTAQLNRSLLETKNEWGVDNIGFSALYDVISEVRSNELIPINLKLLLNKISTLYDYVIKIYPTKIYRKTLSNNAKVVHIDFRSDLQTPMKRRYMRKFMDLSTDIPINFDSQGKLQYTVERFKKIYNIDTTSPQTTANSVKNASQIKALLKSTLFNSKGLGDAKTNIISDPKLVSNNKIALTNGIFPMDANNKIYQPKYTGKLNNIPVGTKYKFGYLQNNANSILKEFGKDEKVSKLTESIKNELFVNSKQAIIKELFGPNGEWDVKVVAKTWAENDASDYTISDWVENIGQRSNLHYYISKKIGKEDMPEVTQFQTQTSMGGV